MNTAKKFSCNTVRKQTDRQTDTDISTDRGNHTTLLAEVINTELKLRT